METAFGKLRGLFLSVNYKLLVIENRLAFLLLVVEFTESTFNESYLVLLFRVELKGVRRLQYFPSLYDKQKN